MLCALAVQGCSLPAGALVAQSRTLAATDNAFGLALLNIRMPSAGGNIAISPLSLALALQIVHGGAAGTAQQAMADALQLGALRNPRLNEDNAALQAALLNPDPQVQLTVANSLWMHLAENPVLPAFIQADQTYYGAAIQAATA